jgi:hypothetical protein
VSNCYPKTHSSSSLQYIVTISNHPQYKNPLIQYFRTRYLQLQYSLCGQPHLSSVDLVNRSELTVWVCAGRLPWGIGYSAEFRNVEDLASGLALAGA